ncbi:MAG: filamentous hemagglutinin N-terminal domain-containing protein [Cyanobacteria bacterium P01_F01_bin.150]
MMLIDSYNLAKGLPLPDTTLGGESSVVSNQGNQVINVEGGAIRETNLFHSFETFNIGIGQEIRFLQPTDTAPVSVMFTRVTGNDPSRIRGSLRVDGNADFFLINPNGILFGQDARLNINGSFIATTAERILFGAPFAFQSDVANAIPAPLLISSPTGIQMGDSPGTISTRSRGTENIDQGLGLALPLGQTLGLIGGDVILRPDSNIQVESGRIELAAVGSDQIILLSSGKTGWRFDFDSVDRFQDLTIKEESSIAGDSFASSTSSRSSAISLRGRNIRITEAEGSSNIGSNSTDGEGGTLTLIATELIELGNEVTLVQAASTSDGEGGDIRIHTPRLLIDRAAITTQSSDNGLGGDIDIEADLVLINGNIDDTLSRERGRISADAKAGSQAGSLTLNAETLILRNSGQLDSGLVEGQLVPESERGAAGNIDVNVSSVFLDNSAQIAAATTGGRGNINLNADLLILNNDSSITASATEKASGGNVLIDTDIITALNGSEISSSAIGGDGGRIEITTEGLVFSPSSTLDVSSQFGNDGTIELFTPDSNPVEDSLEESDQPLDITDLVSTESCTTRRDGSSFYMVGRGGIRESPLDPLPPYLMWEDWETADAMMHLFDDLPSEATTALQPTALVNPPVLQTKENRPVETQGWMRQEDGTVVLLSQSATPSPQGLLLHPHDCQLLQEGLRGDRS